MKTLEKLKWLTIPDPQLSCMICQNGTAKHIATITEGGRVIMSPLVCDSCSDLDETEIKTRFTES